MAGLYGDWFPSKARILTHRSSPGPRSSNSLLVTHWHCFLDVCKRALPTTRPSTPERTVWLTRSLARAPCGRPRSLAVDHDDGSASYYDHHTFLLFGGHRNYLGHSKDLLA